MLQAELRLPKILGDHMVLQQDSAVNIWGHAQPGCTVTVSGSWSTDSVQCVVSDDGTWMTVVKTPVAHSHDPAYRLTISTDQHEQIILEDILIGEVWLLSGQSNMELPLSGWKDSDPPAPIEGGPEAIASAHHPRVRLIAAGRHSAAEPQEEIADHWATSRWTACTPESAEGFSAAGYFFGEELQRCLGLPVGLVLSVWGGSSGETWVPVDGLKQLDAFAQAGPWQPLNEEDNQTPSVLYNGMIAPLRPFAVRGFLWYQGETNVGRADDYAPLFSQLIESWRKEWGGDPKPFFFAHLAPWGGYGPVSLQEMWAAQSAVLALPQTGLVATLDLGDEDNIHPPRKQPIGHRFALLARAQVYGETRLVASGPRCIGHYREGAELGLRFENVGSGLVVPENQYTGFEVAGEDGVFHPAKVRIEGACLLLRSSAVSAPVQARYAWSPNPNPCLFNREGLPAAPFRTPLP